VEANWRTSLRTKIIAWSFVPTAIILSAVAWFTFYSYQKVIGDLAIRQDRDAVRSKMGQVTRATGMLIDPVMVPVFLDTHYYNRDSL